MKTDTDQAASGEDTRTAADQGEDTQAAQAPPAVEAAAPQGEDVAFVVGIGGEDHDVLLSASPERAAALCADGRARPATDAEFAEHRKHGRPIRPVA